MEKKKNSNVWVWVIIIAAVLIFCCCFVILASTAGAGYFLYSNVDDYVSPEIFSELNDDNVEIIRESVSAGALETYQTLEDVLVPENDLRELAERLAGIENIPLTIGAEPEPYVIGNVETFWASNVDTNENFEIQAELAYITDHTYFWVEEGLDYDYDELKELADTFDQKIYPTDREYFGSEWLPGIDNDPRIYLVYADGLGNSLAGYFSSVDSVHPLAHEYSNAHETFFFNADTVDFGEEFTYGVLAHEFQHMIHWNMDKNEETWLNEGFSELASFVNGYDPGGFDTVFAMMPDIQLNHWPDDAVATGSHYGASFMFVTYLHDRFGSEFSRAVVAHPENGFESIDLVFDEQNIRDAQTGGLITSEDVFRDWTVTNILLNANVGDGRYDYHNYPSAPRAQRVDTPSIDGKWEQKSVRQFAADYFEIRSDKPVMLYWEGSTEVGLIEADAHSGDYAFWSNKGDESDMTLTHSFDLSAVAGQVELSYWLWYDLEEDYDYLYLLVSEDGEDWKIIITPSGTDEDISGNSYGWGYNGQSEEWIQEIVDLSDYAGEKIYVRFEYITDAAVNGQGLLLDDVQIKALGYEAGFETDEGGWEADGFVRIQNRLPQTWLLTLIMEGSETVVKELEINSDQSLNEIIDLGNVYDRALLVVSGTTEYTWQPAGYRLMLETLD